MRQSTGRKSHSSHGLTVRTLPAEVMVEWTRRFDPHRQRLLLSETLGPASRAFAVAYQLAAAEHGAEIEAMIAAAAPPETARPLLKVPVSVTVDKCSILSTP